MKTGAPALPAPPGAVLLGADLSSLRDRGASAPFADLLKGPPPKPHAGEDFLGTSGDAADQAARFDAYGLFASARPEAPSPSSPASATIDAFKRASVSQTITGESLQEALGPGDDAVLHETLQSRFSPPMAVKHAVRAQEVQRPHRVAATTTPMAARSDSPALIDAAEDNGVKNVSGLRRSILLRAQSLGTTDHDFIKVTLALNGRDAQVTVTLRAGATDADIERLKRDISAELRRHGAVLAKIDIRFRGGPGDHASARER